MEQGAGLSDPYGPFLLQIFYERNSNYLATQGKKKKICPFPYSRFIAIANSNHRFSKQVMSFQPAFSHLSAPQAAYVLLDI